MPHRLTPQTLRRLTYFAVIADAGSIREAARRLALSPAAVSESLSEFEAELGATLAVRNTRRFKLTEEGQRVAGIAETMLASADELFAEHTDGSELIGQVGITAPVELAHYWLPARLNAFRQAHPHITMSLSASDLMVDLGQSPFDLALRARFVPPGEGVLGTQSLPLCCVSHRPCDIERRGRYWHVRETLIHPAPKAEIDAYDERSGERRKVTFDDVMVVDNKQVALAMIAQGGGVALVTQDAGRATPNVEAIASNLDFGSIRLDLEFRDRRPSRAAIALHGFLINPD